MTTSNSSSATEDLQQHLHLCQELMTIVERESQALRQSNSGFGQEVAMRKSLLPALEQSINSLRRHRVDRHSRSPQAGASEVGIAPLLREIQDLIMKIIVLDRENEQALLRKGLIPARQLPYASLQRPHFVADLYSRQHNLGGRSAVEQDSSA